MIRPGPEGSTGWSRRPGPSAARPSSGPPATLSLPEDADEAAPEAIALPRGRVHGRRIQVRGRPVSAEGRPGRGRTPRRHGVSARRTLDVGRPLVYHRAVDGSIADEFGTLSRDDWVARAEQDLKGAPLASLRTPLTPGVDLEPLYTAAEGALPASVRGRSGAWVIRQEYDDPRMEVCRDAIREDLARGVEAITLVAGLEHGGQRSAEPPAPRLQRSAPSVARPRQCIRLAARVHT